jgi:hypothetical protein
MLQLNEINEANFNEKSIEIYNWQRMNVSVYREYLNLTNRNLTVEHWTQITFLPIAFFKSHVVMPSNSNAEIVFKSSGTGGVRSEHHVTNILNYQNSFRLNWLQTYGPPEEKCILALLPNYINNGDSSLVYMMNDLIQQGMNGSGFYLNNFEKLKNQLEHNEKKNIPTLLIGVTYALLDFAKTFPMNLQNTIVMETGGMKGTRKELPKSQVHDMLKQAFNCKEIHSEYGMTELLSQAYAKQNGIFHCPPWMRVLIREVTDPYQYSTSGKRGGVNIVDLANWQSCSFIETQDIGITPNCIDFEVVGRVDQADLRGCNLLVAEM